MLSRHGRLRVAIALLVFPMGLPGCGGEPASEPADAGGDREPRAVAEFGYAALKRRQVVAVHGWRNWLLSCTPRIAPRSVVRPIVKAMNDWSNRPALDDLTLVLLDRGQTMV